MEFNNDAFKCWLSDVITGWMTGCPPPARAWTLWINVSHLSKPLDASLNRKEIGMRGLARQSTRVGQHLTSIRPILPPIGSKSEADSLLASASATTRPLPKVLFNAHGRSPLTEHFLQMKGLQSVTGPRTLLERTQPGNHQRGLSHSLLQFINPSSLVWSFSLPSLNIFCKPGIRFAPLNRQRLNCDVPTRLISSC
eukprot:m.153658 g.153658  ORF g.153658 m.153658 type:complete len:196 (-) comp52867_c0_seq6:1093-1680(-)